MDFVNGIRSIMRQDPDIILVGEVRDRDTAEMAFRAAAAGHQVFTTLHTNSALGAFPGCSTSASCDIIAGNVIGIIARLVRMLCSQCKEAYSPSKEERHLLALSRGQRKIYRPTGCKRCFRSYRGRAAIMESCAWTPTWTNWWPSARPLSRYEPWPSRKGSAR
jgi:general secretion pathway protein E/type IV pilus assembly protein PilB